MENIRIIHKTNTPTDEAINLIKALKDKGVNVDPEVYDGFKTVDLSIRDSKIDIEVDGIQHLTDPYQILADIDRGYYSYLDGYHTMHIPNQMIHKYLPQIAAALTEASKIRKQKISVHVN